ncbi:DUF4364 family protein [Candidatus Micrarchaeota archaeon]|nr:DUF4364 family protein [Candidatus Micrarchaeota archaeon]
MLLQLIKDKPLRILLALKEPESVWYLSKLAKATGTTYVFVTHFISKLEKTGIVTMETKGKKRFAKLTEKGMQVATLFEEIRNKLETKSVSIQQ